MKSLKVYQLSLFLAVILSISSCKKDDPIPQPAADFTYEVSARKVVFTNTSLNSETYSWNFGDGSAVSMDESPTHQYITGGDYNVVLTAVGAVGTTTSTKTVKITLLNPVNLLKGGSMETADKSSWTILQTAATPANFKFGETVNKPTAGIGGGLGFSDPEAGVAHTGGSIFFQAVQLEVGEYQWSADVKITTGTNKDNAADTKSASQFWLEFYCGPDMPIDLDGYDKSTMIGGFNYWVAQVPAHDIPSVDGNFSKNCVLFDEYGKTILHTTNIDGLNVPNDEGKFAITTAGTYYFVFKMGTWEGRFGDGGIVLDNLRLFKL